jgi:uncharacterized membrane protein
MRTKKCVCRHSYSQVYSWLVRYIKHLFIRSIGDVVESLKLNQPVLFSIRLTLLMFCLKVNNNVA